MIDVRHQVVGAVTVMRNSQASSKNTFRVLTSTRPKETVNAKARFRPNKKQDSNRSSAKAGSKLIGTKKDLTQAQSLPGEVYLNEGFSNTNVVSVPEG